MAACRVAIASGSTSCKAKTKRMSLSFLPSVATALILALATAGVVLLIWLIPRRQVRTIAEADVARRIELENELRKTAIQAAGGAALLVGLVFTWLQFSVAREDAAEDRNARTEELALTRSSMMADRFSRAVEQLSDQRGTVQLGGIYSLQELGGESREYQLMVASVLTSHIRARLGIRFAETDPPSSNIDPEVRRVAIEALRVVSSLNPWQTPEALPYIPFYDVGYKPTKIERSRLDVRGVSLGYTDLSGLDLRGAILESSHLAEADLTGTDLTGAMLADADLSRADATGVRLRGADLRYARLEGADLQGADLSYAWIGSPHSPTGARLDYSNFQDADISGLNLEGYELDESDLKGVCGDQKTKIPKGLGKVEPCEQR